MIVLPPHGKIELIGQYGTDLDVVNAAKTSFAKESSSLGISERKILEFLLRSRHGSPFEHNYFKFRVCAPLFVVGQWKRHRIGIAHNEESGRYVNMRRRFYVPNGIGIRTQYGKPGAYTFKPLDSKIRRKLVRGLITMQNHGAFNTYKVLTKLGVAKELARSVLPQGMYVEFIWSCNARSLMHFLSLRNEDQAGFEIRQYARSMEALFSSKMPYTHQFFVDHGRKAP